MNKRFQRLSKKQERFPAKSAKRKLSSQSLILPPDFVDDWLKRNRPGQQPSREEQPVVELPAWRRKEKPRKDREVERGVDEDVIAPSIVDCSI